MESRRIFFSATLRLRIATKKITRVFWFFIAIKRQNLKESRRFFYVFLELFKMLYGFFGQALIIFPVSIYSFTIMRLAFAPVSRFHSLEVIIFPSSPITLIAAVFGPEVPWFKASNSTVLNPLSRLTRTGV